MGSSKELVKATFLTFLLSFPRKRQKTIGI